MSSPESNDSSSKPTQKENLSTEVDSVSDETRERAKNPALWDKNNQWFDEFYKALEGLDLGEAEKKAGFVEKFLDGEISWAELQGIAPDVLFEIAQYGYVQFRRNRFKEAEVIFKGLSVLDSQNAYYHAVLGAIYQRMDEWGEALVEYTVAIELDPKEITAYVNRGEISYRLGYVDEPLEDFEKAIVLDPQGKDPWANRARFLKNKILEEEAQLKK